MKIYVDEFYDSFRKKKKKININLVKNTLKFLKNKNNFQLSSKMTYYIIYLVKHDCKFIIINKVIQKLLFTVSYRFSLFTFHCIRSKWTYIINISIYNKVNEKLLDYFFTLYDSYLNTECNNDKNMITTLYKMQCKNIFNITVQSISHLRRYFKLNIHHTIYLIDIIFSVIDKKYISLDYIFDTTKN